MSIEGVVIMAEKGEGQLIEMWCPFPGTAVGEKPAVDSVATIGVIRDPVSTTIDFHKV